jgi:hypothetical protein
MVKTSVTRVFFRIVKRCDKRVPATIGGSTERLQGTVGPSGAIDHQTDPPGQLGAVSRPSELTDGRYSRMSQIEQVNIVAMFAAWTTAWRLCVEPPRAHGLLSHSCSWFEPQTPPTARTWRLLRPLRNVAVAIDRLSLRRFNDAEQVRSDELLARCCWHHLFERSGSTVSAPRSVAVVLTRQLLAPGVSGRVTHSTHCVCASLEHDGQTAVRKY